MNTHFVVGPRVNDFLFQGLTSCFKAPSIKINL